MTRRVDASHLAPPQSLEMEQAALGSMLLDERAVDAVADLISPSDFYRTAHGVIFDVIVTLHRLGRAVDLLTVQEELRARDALDATGGSPYLVHLLDTVPSASNAEFYARVVAEKATLRRILDASSQIAAIAHTAEYDDISDVCDAAFRAVSDAIDNRDTRRAREAKEVVDEILETLERLRASGSIPGVSTGFIDLDNATAGLGPGELIVVAGAASMGKSAFALQVGRNVARTAGPVLVVSLEMSDTEILHRQLSIDADVDLLRLRRAKLSDAEMQRVQRAAARLRQERVLVHDRGVDSVSSIRSAVRRMRPAPAMLIIDYLQIMRIEKSSDNRAQDLGAICRDLKRIGRDHRIPVMLLSQLSREIAKRSDRRPTLTDLRDSGAIEQDADIVIGLYRDEYYKSQDASLDVSHVEEAELLLLKQRNGPRGRIRAAFRTATAQWANATRPDQDRIYRDYITPGKGVPRSCDIVE